MWRKGGAGGRPGGLTRVFVGFVSPARATVDGAFVSAASVSSAGGGGFSVRFATRPRVRSIRLARVRMCCDPNRSCRICRCPRRRVRVCAVGNRLCKKLGGAARLGFVRARATGCRRNPARRGSHGFVRARATGCCMRVRAAWRPLVDRKKSLAPCHEPAAESRGALRARQRLRANWRTARWGPGRSACVTDARVAGWGMELLRAFLGRGGLQVWCPIGCDGCSDGCGNPGGGAPRSG